MGIHQLHFRRHIYHSGKCCLCDVCERTSQSVFNRTLIFGVCYVCMSGLWYRKYWILTSKTKNATSALSISMGARRNFSREMGQNHQRLKSRQYFPCTGGGFTRRFRPNLRVYIARAWAKVKAFHESPAYDVIFFKLQGSRDKGSRDKSSAPPCGRLWYYRFQLNCGALRLSE